MSAVEAPIIPIGERAQRRRPKNLPHDVELLSWAAEQLGIAESTAYRLAPIGAIPGAFRVGAQWRVSVPKFEREVHGGVDPRTT